MSGAEAGPPQALPPVRAPHRVRVPVNVHHWGSISFLHWRLDPDDVSALLPAGLDVLTYDGAAWVSLTPFRMRARPPGLPVVPPGWAFAETNLRTYVTGPDGRQGLWFHRMEAGALWFTIALRSVGLPYVWQRMSVETDGERVRYSSRPHRVNDHGGGHDIEGRVGAALQPPEGGALERFLLPRWGAYHRRGPWLLHTPVEHAPWRLHELHLDTVEVDDAFRAAGLPQPEGPPVAHFSPGVTVKIGFPQRVG